MSETGAGLRSASPDPQLPHKRRPLAKRRGLATETPNKRTCQAELLSCRYSGLPSDELLLTHRIKRLPLSPRQKVPCQANPGSRVDAGVCCRGVGDVVLHTAVQSFR